MLIKINEEEFDFNTKLGAAFKIEERFKKPYIKAITGVEEMRLKEQIDLLSCGLETQEDIKRLKEVLENDGFGNLMDVLEQFIDGLQYPGLTEDEIVEKKLEKVKRQKKLKALGLID